jgi:hypothetical protein
MSADKRQDAAIFIGTGKKKCPATFTIGEARLRQSQLPAQVQRADGFILNRPVHWR